MAIIIIDYCTFPNQNKQVFYDNVTHTVLVNDTDVLPSLCISPVVDGDVIYTQKILDGGNVIGEYEVLAKPALNFYNGEVKYTPKGGGGILLCNAVILDAVVVPESLPGAADGQVTLVSSPANGLEFNIDGGAWETDKVFPGLTSGFYEFGVRRDDSLCEGVTRIVEVTANSQLSASFEKTDVTANGLSDGTITISVVGGSGNYSFLWSDAVITKNRIDIPAGLYSLTVTDDVTLLTFDLDDIPINEPAIIAPPILGTILHVPQVNSLHFVDDSIIDPCNNPQNADNTFLLEQGDRFMKRDPYFQKVSKCDVLNIQLNSDFKAITAQLISCETGALFKSFLVTKIIENIGNFDTLNIRIQNNGNASSRVYFTGSMAVPILLKIGDPIEIINNIDGFEGVYEVVNILNDEVLGAQYLVINANYGILVPSSLAEGVFKDQALDFDIFNVRADFSGLVDGYYYVKIAGLNGLVESIITKSEPILLLEHHEATINIAFTNIDNAFDINYQFGLIHQIRVPGRMYKRTPGGKTTSIRSTNGQVTKLSAKPERKFILEFSMLPSYLHELISLAFDHDTVRINGVLFGSQEGLAEPSYIDGYNLSNSSIIVEQKEWFETYNGDDLGGLNNEGGFIDNDQKGFITLK